MPTIRSFGASAPSPAVGVIASAARTALAAMLAAAICLLVVRRLAGAFSDPLPIGAFALLGFLFAAAAVLVRQALARCIPHAGHPLGHEEPHHGEHDGYTWIHCTGTLIAVAGALSVSLPTASALGLLAVWLPVALEEGWTSRQWFAGRPFVVPPSGSTTNESEVIALDSALADLAFADTTVTQHLVRRRELDGGESISGCLRAAFLPGQRTVNVHVPFCPPLNSLPPCSAETIDGPPARVKVAQVFPQGARLEVRLDTTATEPQQVVIEFSTT